MTANTCGAELFRKYVSIRIVEMNIPFFAPTKRQNSIKHFQVCTTGNVKKVVKADRRLILLFHFFMYEMLWFGHALSSLDMH